MQRTPLQLYKSPVSGQIAILEGLLISVASKLDEFKALENAAIHEHQRIVTRTEKLIALENKRVTLLKRKEIRELGTGKSPEVVAKRIKTRARRRLLKTVTTKENIVKPVDLVLGEESTIEEEFIPTARALNLGSIGSVESDNWLDVDELIDDLCTEYPEWDPHQDAISQSI